MLIEGRNIEILGLDGCPLRRLVLDPATTSQPQPLHTTDKKGRLPKRRQCQLAPPV
jgi:hypothetical protein